MIIWVFPIIAQANKVEILQNLETNQNDVITATLKSSSRLFKDKEDLTSVILIIPSGSTVNVLASDSIYLHVNYMEDEGFIYRRDAVIDKNPIIKTQPVQSRQPEPETQPAQEQNVSRYAYLENKYGSSMAARLNDGKIWKGMNSEMVKDSWGKADKINRTINGNIIKEEWIFSTTWLYFENNTLLEWGPVKK